MPRLKNVSTKNQTESPARRSYSRSDYEDFHETLAAPIPNRTYRSEIDMTVDRSPVAEQAVRLIATVALSLLGVRFITSLLTSDSTNEFVRFMDTLTGWLVSPFQSWLGRPALSTGGLIDLPALAAIATVLILAALVIRVLRPRLEY